MSDEHQRSKMMMDVWFLYQNVFSATCIIVSIITKAVFLRRSPSQHFHPGRFKFRTTYPGIVSTRAEPRPEKGEPYFHNYQLKFDEDSTSCISIFESLFSGPNMLNTTCKPQKASSTLINFNGEYSFQLEAK